MSAPTESAAHPPESEPSAAASSRPVSHRPDASQLQDRVPEWAQLSRVTVLWTLLLGIVWLVFNYQPLWHTDLWGHLNYGRLIVAEQALPLTEPTLPLASGVPFRDTAWLSQVIGYGMYAWQGVAGLRFLFATSLMTCVLLLLFRFRERTDSVLVSVLGLAIFLGVAWRSLMIARPQLGGLACFVALIVLTTGKRWKTWHAGLVMFLFAFWANLHGSFPIGLGYLGLLTLGRVGDVWWRTGQLQRVWHDDRVRRWFVLTELALIAVLLTPHGIGIFSAVSSIANHPNLKHLVEWNPVTLRMTHGKSFLIAALAMMLVYRRTPRRISGSELLLLGVFGLSALWSVRMMVWVTPIAAWYFVLHASAIQRRWQHRRQLQTARQHPPAINPPALMNSTAVDSPATNETAENETNEEESGALFRPHSGLNTAVTLGMLWIFFAYTPFGSTLLHGTPSDPQLAERFYRKSLSRDTPVELTAYLRTHPPVGLVFNPYEWGDYLQWAGPQGLQVFLNSHAHLLPEEVWQDYFTLLAGGSAAADKLDRYGVNTIILDKQHRQRLINDFKQNNSWQLDYEDQQGTIFLRRTPIIAP